MQIRCHGVLGYAYMVEQRSNSDLDNVYNAPDLFVRTPRRNQSYPWDEHYRPSPYQQSAYDFWEEDIRRKAGNVHPYNNERHQPGSMEADDYNDMNDWLGGDRQPYFFSQEYTDADTDEEEEGDSTFPFLGTDPDQSAYCRKLPAVDRRNAVPVTGGEGLRPCASIQSHGAYAGAGDLGAIHSPYYRRTPSADEIRTGGYNCSSGHFMKTPPHNRGRPFVVMTPVSVGSYAAETTASSKDLLMLLSLVLLFGCVISYSMMAAAKR